MTRVILHQLPGTKKGLEACRLIEALYLAGKRVVVWSADAARAALLDEYLWTFAQHSFVAHSRWTGRGDADDPVVIVTGTLANPGSAEVLVVLDRLAEPAQASPFVEVHDLLARTAEDEGKAELWRGAGFAVSEVAGLGIRARR